MWTMHIQELYICLFIGLYRDVWIAAIASSRTRLATLTGAMCNTSQCEFRSLRVNSGMLNVIRIVTYYIITPIRVARLFLDCNGDFAIKAYRDVRIAAIASSRTSMATLSEVMCNTSQCKLRSLRVLMYRKKLTLRSRTRVGLSPSLCESFW